MQPVLSLYGACRLTCTDKPWVEQGVRSSYNQTDKASFYRYTNLLKVAAAFCQSAFCQEFQTIWTRNAIGQANRTSAFTETWCSVYTGTQLAITVNDYAAF